MKDVIEVNGSITKLQSVNSNGGALRLTVDVPKSQDLDYAGLFNRTEVPMKAKFDFTNGQQEMDFDEEEQGAYSEEFDPPEFDGDDEAEEPETVTL